MTYCCKELQFFLNYQFDVFRGTYEFPSNLLAYNAVLDEYGINMKDGTSFVPIRYCPWCGQPLPESKMNRYISELQQMGYEQIFSEEVPDEFKSDEWWRKRGL